ncbi:hypothetical protein [Dysgonomonas sp. 25]|uniref:hypothetical protein n=1 Tax=Dysgonomonas sp. 25 TaxID=2302933 RepID=UPI0013D73986|nr:hypothetical protein [Dysgonomonas sp. 25]NDV68631.1 hypothetical protein [Dysgonomonas sp. 25]
MKKITYKELLAASDSFRKTVEQYIESKQYYEDKKILCNKILDAINEKSKADKQLRIEAYKYFICQSDYKTIKLREICKAAGYDFWADKNSDLSISNAINTIDTAHVYHEINLYKETFTLQKLSKYEVKDGDVALKTGYAGITVQNFLENYLKEKGYNLTMTQLYRVNFKDNETCTTWRNADINPVTVDILAIELNYRYVSIIADLGDGAMPIALDMREGGNVVVTPVYNNYDWIKEATYYQLQAICDVVAERFEDSKNELLSLKPKVK